MSTDKILSFLGLARKAGKLVAGDALCESMLVKHKVRLVILAADASDRTKRRFEALCLEHRTPIAVYGEKTEIGGLLGRDAYAVAAVADEGFATRIQQLIRDNDPEIAHGGGLIEQKNT